MSELQPLLDNTQQDIEANPVTDADKAQSWREWTAHRLDSRPVHSFFLSLIILDSLLAVGDLAYSFLTSECIPLDRPARNPPLLEASTYASIVISSFFMVELPVTLWAMGFSYYIPFQGTPHAGFHLLDAVVIVTTFTLEVSLRGKEREVAGLLILLRLWRIVKLAGDVAVGVGEITEGTQDGSADTQTMDDKDRTIEELRQEVTQLRAQLAQGT